MVLVGQSRSCRGVVRFEREGAHRRTSHEINVLWRPGAAKSGSMLRESLVPASKIDIVIAFTFEAPGLTS